ncbi:HD domain-containing protein [Streptomyces sp. BE20]|uniref:HD domain-containing protein n=1 Tax=Streptomyces sp. BE20 TaxID=3002525 RepID=UPI002E794004|nr:HD domain-containing protein [Streptomyces sp. BE20]MEE1823360.1 HD domain-containing protein [Streptomyces sp. BE20]
MTTDPTGSADHTTGATEIAGVAIPDSRLAVEATELVRDTSTELLYHHSRRVYLFGALQGHRRGLAFDPELLYLAAMFHDVGLAPEHRSSGRRFEVDGAEAAAAFLRAHQVPEQRVRLVWEAIALHTTPGVPEYLEPEIALTTAGVELDVLGIGYHDLPAGARDAVVAAHPRPDFKRGILRAFHEGIAPKPETAFGNVKADVLARFSPGFERTDFVDVIEGSDWPE